METATIADFVPDQPKAKLFQIRDPEGRKRLETSNPEEIAEILNRQPNIDGWEVMVLDGKPGKILSVTPATDFLN